MDFYRQTSQYTGAATSMLMALNHLKPDTFPLNREQEFRIWRKTTNLPTRSSSIYALATISHEAGIPTIIIVGEREYDYPDYRFKRYKKIEIDDAKFSSKQHAKNARTKKVPIEEREFTLEEVQTQLRGNKLVLLRVNAGIFRDKKATSKYVLLTNYNLKTKNYTVMDPEHGEKKVPNNIMKEAFETLVTKKKRDHRMIILG